MITAGGKRTKALNILIKMH